MRSVLEVEQCCLEEKVVKKTFGAVRSAISRKPAIAGNGQTHRLLLLVEMNEGTFAVWSKSPVHVLGHHYRLEIPILLKKAFGFAWQHEDRNRSLGNFMLDGIDWHAFHIDWSGGVSYEVLEELKQLNTKYCHIERFEESQFKDVQLQF